MSKLLGVYSTKNMGAHLSKKHSEIWEACIRFVVLRNHSNYTHMVHAYPELPLALTYCKVRYARRDVFLPLNFQPEAFLTREN